MLNRSSSWRGILALVLPGLCFAHESTDATLWMQTSAEYRGLVAQIFDQARRRLPDVLAASPDLGALENGPNAASKPPAVILDIDEAVMDNGPYQAMAIIRGRRGFDPDAWDEWVMRHRADALPGALDYVRAAQELGIEVFYVTNRTCSQPKHCPQQEATIRNLVDLGFEDVDDARVLMKNEQPDWTSEKSVRRAEITRNFRIVQLIGDDLGDFIPGARQAGQRARLDMVAQHRRRFGYTWYLFPNPVYGSWTKALGASALDHLQPDPELLCLGALTPIGHIQGPGNSSHCTGLTVTTRGVVTLVSTGEAGLGGYFIQDSEGDGNPVTADAIFVVDGDNTGGIAQGDFVEIRARVAERDGLTALEPQRPNSVTVLDRGRSVTPTPIRLPESFDGELERYEGMLIAIPQPMTVTGNRWMDDLGQLKLASADDRGRTGRLFQPTQLALPGSLEAKRIRRENARRFLVFDDGKGLPPDPLPFIGEPDPDTTLRVGDQITDILGILDYGEITPFGTGNHRFDYRIQALRPANVLPRNHRPRAPTQGTHDLRIVSANLQNFFTGLGRDQCRRPCESGKTIKCRGAKNDAEFERQKLKLAAALAPLSADIYGFQEVQNNGFGRDSAIAALTDLLGDEFGFIHADDRALGCHAISVGLAYRSTVRPIGRARVLDTGPFDAFKGGASRASLAQVFEHKGTGERFTVVVNHFKSRRASELDRGDAELQDDQGQGYWNLRRTESAEHLVHWLDSLGHEIDPDTLIIGDLNAYAREDPLRVLESAGYTNLLRVNDGEQTATHTYVHEGLSGALDHVLVSTGLVERASAFAWPINADEPKVMDYRLRGLGADWFHETPFRASDHDPVIVDVTFDRERP